eukprot:gb/GEZN01014433.1/.p1 GENE.gb/GEZN01014433.1/~~gb/GEZN01014433.1/.p1  ORF type:complete len:221 (+),score=11.12 gb/GEZN01014433.1/:76-738(+)
MELYMGALALSCNVLGMAGTWHVVEAKHDDPDHPGSVCTVHATVGLWSNICFTRDCYAGNSYSCTRVDTSTFPLDEHWMVTQAFMCLAFLLSLFAMVALCAVFQGYPERARKAVACLWLVAAICGIVCMAVWIEYVTPNEYVGLGRALSQIYGWGFIFCILGWILSLVTGIAIVYVAKLDLEWPLDAINFGSMTPSQTGMPTLVPQFVLQKSIHDQQQNA